MSSKNNNVQKRQNPFIGFIQFSKEIRIHQNDMRKHSIEILTVFKRESIFYEKRRGKPLCFFPNKKSFLKRLFCRDDESALACRHEFADCSLCEFLTRVCEVELQCRVCEADLDKRRESPCIAAA